MSFSTAQLCDDFSDNTVLQIADPIFQAFGGKTAFFGQIVTLKVFEDQVLVTEALAKKGAGKVLAIDGGGSHRVALLGLELVNLALANQWQGLVIYGCIRDSAAIAELPIGIRALHAQPMPSHRKGLGEQGTTVNFAGINFKNDHFLYADTDGIVVSAMQLI